MDRRNEKRTKAVISIFWKIPGAAHPVKVESFDLSENGISFWTDKEMKIDTLLGMEVTVTLVPQLEYDETLQEMQVAALPTDQSAFVAGNVRSCHKVDGNWRCGVLFEGPESELASSLLKEYIEIVNDKEYIEIVNDDEMH